MNANMIMNEVWGMSEGKYVFLPQQKAGVWQEGPAYDALGTHFTGQAPGVDHYFTPLVYTGTQRRKGMLGRPGVIFADLDGDHIEEPRLKPSLIIATSPNHYHAYWFLNEPVEAVDWEGAAKGWSQEIGADPGGWDATQVLRVPSTFNYKYNPPHGIYVQSFEPGYTYDLEQFPRARVEMNSVLEPEPLPSKTETAYLIRAGIEDDRLPLSVRYWLTITPGQLLSLGRIDRSAIMWEVERQLIRSGYSSYEIFHLMYHAAINKYNGRPDRLWKEIARAIAYSK